MSRGGIKNYNVIVQKVDNKFHLTIAELMISVSGEDLVEVYHGLESKKEEALRSMKESGMDYIIPSPNIHHNVSLPTGRRLFWDEILMFLAKLTILGLIIALLGGIFYQFGKPLITGFTHKIKMIPNKMTKIPQDKVIDAAEKTKELIKKFSPILDEIKPLYDPEPANRKK